MDYEQPSGWAGPRTFEDLTLLFRHSLRTRSHSSEAVALQRVEARFDLEPYKPRVVGAMDELLIWLADLKVEDRVDWVLDAISKASNPLDRLSEDVARTLLEQCGQHDIVRFTFAPTMLVCLRHAIQMRREGRKRHDVYHIRYAGVGADVQLIAFASLYIGCPVYAELNPPWERDQLADGYEPLNENPDFEISFPPSELMVDQYPQLEESVKRVRIPRGVDRGRFAIECVMMVYLANESSTVLAFVSENLVASTRQSCLHVRQKLISLRRVARITETVAIGSDQLAGADHLIELSSRDLGREMTKMTRARAVKELVGWAVPAKELIRVSQFASYDEIVAAGYTLRPKRYIYRSIVSGIRHWNTPMKHRIADFFDIIRPKATKDDPVGTEPLLEIRAGNLTELGEIERAYRRVTIRDTKLGAIDEQRVKKGDILFAHRGPIGRVAYVLEEQDAGNDLWASQTVMIIRRKPKLSTTLSKLKCNREGLFLYLLNENVRTRWSDVAIGYRSPAIPIGEIEREGIPDKLIGPARSSGKGPKPVEHKAIEKLIAQEFEAYQRHLKIMHDAKRSLNAGLDSVRERIY